MNYKYEGNYAKDIYRRWYENHPIFGKMPEGTKKKAVASIHSVLEIKENVFFFFHKEKLETSFCYGYYHEYKGSYERAAYNVRKVTTDKDFFINECLKAINYQIADFVESSDVRYDFDSSSVSTRAHLVSGWAVKRTGGESGSRLQSNREERTLVPLTTEQKEDYLCCLYSLRENLRIRAEQYINRYGFKNVKAWLYNEMD